MTEHTLSVREQADALADRIMHMRRFGRASGREVSAELLAALGNPERGMRVVHIAGTNGKGSTAAFLAQILQEAGYRTGLFTSPHLTRFDERIRVNGEPIPDEAWLRLGARVLDAPCSLERTMFDCCLAIGLLYFAEKQCDLVVLETGLGGTLDSTNALSIVPEVSVITAIGYDHTAILGDTLAEIAENKAGILKPGTCAVLAKMEEEPLKVLAARCRERGIEFVSVRDPRTVLRSLTPDCALPALGLPGLYQQENAANAVLAAERLLAGLPAEERTRCILQGLKSARWPGRMELLHTKDGVSVLLDGSHNPQGIRALYDSLASRWPGRKFLFLMGVVAEKDYPQMVRVLAPVAEGVFCAPLDSERSLAASALAEQFLQCGVPARAYASVAEALAQASAQWKKTPADADEDVSDTDGEVLPVIACGSLYFIGELRGMLAISE